MAPPKKRTLPKPLPDGFVLTDMEKKRWRLGRLIGQGGFGLIYLASQNVDQPVSANSEFVIKVEYLENGPLFSELKFYQRAAKKEMIQNWMTKKKLDFLGIPRYWGSGQAEYNDRGYRFMAMDRLGSDLQKICDRNQGRLKPDTVLQLGTRLVDMLEYIHENEYVHSDIKAANLMLGHSDPHQVYLADYGLSYRYCPEGVHKEYKENPKKGHNGTIEYTSLDAHKGVAPSRRSDLQILGFCLLHWLCGHLPWDQQLQSPERVQEAKSRFMESLPRSVREISSCKKGTDAVVSFLQYVKSLEYQEKPDYQLLRGILSCSRSGLDLDPPSVLEMTPAPGLEDPASTNKKPGRSQRQSQSEEMEEEKKNKPKQISPRYLRRPPIDKTQQASDSPMEVDEVDEEEPTRRPKQIPAKYLRGPPITKPQTEDMEVDDEEEERKPKQIPAKYLRGPPAKNPDPQATVRIRESRTNWRRDIHNNWNVDDRSQTNGFTDYLEFLDRDSGFRAGPVVETQSIRWHWFIYGGICFLIALVTLFF